VDKRLRVFTISFGIKQINHFPEEKEYGQKEAKRAIYAQGSGDCATWIELSDGVSGDCPKLLYFAFNRE
jgi:hypothetical protein